MANGQGEYKIKLTTEADLKDAKALQRAIDETTVKVTGLEKASKKAAAAQTEAQRTIPFSGQSGLASGGKKSAAQLRAEEMAAGLETERQMKAQGIALDADGTKKYAQGIPKTATGIQTPAQAAAAFVASQKAMANAATASAATQGTAIEGMIGRFIRWAAVIGTVRKAIHEYVEDERAMASLDAALAQRSQLTDQFRESLAKLADELEGRTAIDSSQWLGAITTLTKFGANPQNIGALTKGVEDLAGVMGGDLNSAAVAIGKALNGSTNALTRYGFKIDETKSKQEQINSLLEQFAERGGGQLEARAKTLSGEFSKMTLGLGNLGSAFVGATSKAGFMQFWFKAISEAANFYADKIGTLIPKVDGLTNSLSDSASAYEDVESGADGAATAIDKVKKAADEAAAALEKEKEAMRDNSNHAINMIEANAKLEKAKIDQAQKLGLLTPQQAAIRRAEVDRKKEQAVFGEKQRADNSVVAFDKMEGQRLNAELMKRENEIADLQARAAKANEARSDATRLRSLADESKGDVYAASGPESRKALRRQGLTDEEINRGEIEARIQRDKAEGAASAAEERANQFANEPSAAAFRSEIQEKTAQKNEFSRAAREQSQKLDAEIKAKERDISQRAGVFGVDARTQFTESRTGIMEAGGGVPNVVRNQADVLRAAQTEQNAIGLDFAQAVRARDIERARQDKELARALGTVPSRLDAMQRIIDQLTRGTGNRPPP